MSSNPFSAQASFNVMNPQASANALLQSAVQERMGDKKNFQSGLNNAVMQVAANMRNQRAQEGAMARELQKEQAQTELTKFKSELDATAAEATEQRAFEKDIASGKFLIDLSKNTRELGATLGPEAARQFYTSGLQVLEKNFGILPESQKAIVLQGLGDGSVAVSEEPMDDSLFGESFTAGAAAEEKDPLADLMETIKLDRQKARGEALKASAEGDMKEGELKDLNNLKKGVEESAKRLDDIIEMTPLSARQDEMDAEELLIRQIDDEIASELTYKDSAKKYRENKTAYSENALAHRELVDNLLRMKKSLVDAKEYEMEFDFNAAKELRAFVGTIGDGDEEAVKEWVNSAKFDSIFVGGENVAPEKRQEVVTEFLIGLSQLKSKGAALARAGGEVGVLTNEDINRALSQFLAQGANPIVFEANLDDGIQAVVGHNIRGAYKFGHAPNLKVFRSLAAENNLSYDPRTLTLKVRGEDPMTISSEPLEGTPGFPAAPMIEPTNNITGVPTMHNYLSGMNDEVESYLQQPGSREEALKELQRRGLR